MNKALLRLRHEMGLTQAQLAEMVDLHPRTLQNAEIGVQPLSPRAARRIAEKTGYSEDWLLRGIDDQYHKFADDERRARDNERYLGQQRPKSIELKRLAISMTLLRDYLLFRHLFAGLLDSAKPLESPGGILERWRMAQAEALSAFLERERLGEQLKNTDSAPKLNRQTLRSIWDDADMVDAALAVAEQAQAFAVPS
jgi:transcriptional regulator with XRE-family HTH domain